MRRLLFIAVTLSMMIGLAPINAYAADTSTSIEQLAKKQLTMEDFENLSEEQIKALLLLWSQEDIYRYLNMIMSSGRMTVIANMLEAMNSHIATSPMTPEQRVELAQKIAANNPGIGIGFTKGGVPVLFVAKVNKVINSMIRHNNSNDKFDNQTDGIPRDRNTVSGGATKN